MKSEMHQRAFLSVRKLLQIAGFTDFDLHYDVFGKPHLNGDKHISITHSHEFSAIIISNETVGIDIELQRKKIIRIADKFCNSEFQFLEPNNEEEYIQKLTVIWGAKEAIFKIRNEKGISFKNHIFVNQFSLNATQNNARLYFNNLIMDFNIHFEEIENFILVYAFQKDTKSKMSSKKI
jgi:phosphopantetheinyl transferase